MSCVYCLLSTVYCLLSTVCLLLSTVSPDLPLLRAVEEVPVCLPQPAEAGDWAAGDEGGHGQGGGGAAPHLQEQTVWERRRVVALDMLGAGSILGIRYHTWDTDTPA